jgi:hypothetical protein
LCFNKKAISENDIMNAFCYTWTNPGTTGRDKDIYYRDGTFEWYYSIDSDVPSYRGTFTIEEARSDREGNIWVIVHRKGYEGYALIVEKALYRISKLGTVLEIAPFSGDTVPDGVEWGFSYMMYRQE